MALLKIAFPIPNIHIFRNKRVNVNLYFALFMRRKRKKVKMAGRKKTSFFGLKKKAGKKKRPFLGILVSVFLPKI